jgi:hypothetical protein
MLNIDDIEGASVKNNCEKGCLYLTMFDYNKCVSPTRFPSASLKTKKPLISS